MFLRSVKCCLLHILPHTTSHNGYDQTQTHRFKWAKNNLSAGLAFILYVLTTFRTQVGQYEIQLRNASTTDTIIHCGKKLTKLADSTNALLSHMLFATIFMFTALAAAGIYLSTGLARAIHDAGLEFQPVVLSFGVANAMKSGASLPLGLSSGRVRH